MIAHIQNSVVVNISVEPPDPKVRDAWIAANAHLADHFLILERGGVGWEEYKDGKIRPAAPSADCVWKETKQMWDCPEPLPYPEPV